MLRVAGLAIEARLPMSTCDRQSLPMTHPPSPRSAPWRPSYRSRSGAPCPQCPAGSAGCASPR
eukprot:15011302-Heterocapsa_arctica.AAC.1